MSIYICNSLSKNAFDRDYKHISIAGWLFFKIKDNKVNARKPVQSIEQLSTFHQRHSAEGTMSSAYTLKFYLNLSTPISLRYLECELQKTCYTSDKHMVVKRCFNVHLHLKYVSAKMPSTETISRHSYLYFLKIKDNYFCLSTP